MSGRDRLTIRKLGANDWTVIPVSWDDVVKEPDGVLADPRSALDRTPTW